MKTTHLLALVLTAGTALQAQAYDSEYAVSQSLSGFVASDSGTRAQPAAGAFRGESAINRDLAGLESPAPARDGDPMRYAFRNEYDLNHGGAGYAPTPGSAGFSTGGAGTPVVFRGEYQLNRDQGGFEVANTARVADGVRHDFRNEYDLTHGIVAVAAARAAAADDMRIGLQSEFELNRQLAGFAG